MNNSVSLKSQVSASDRRRSRRQKEGPLRSAVAARGRAARGGSAQEDYEADDASYPGEEGPSPVWELALYGKECVVCEGDQGDMSKPGKVILEAL